MVQNRKRQREHDFVRGDLERARSVLEGEGVTAGRRAPRGDQRGAGHNPRAEPGREQGDDLVVAPADVILLVRLTKEGELIGFVEAEQVQQVQRALTVALRAILDGVSHVEQLTETRPDAARHGLVDPVRDGHSVELGAAGGEAVVERRVVRFRDVAPQLGPDGFEIARRLLVSVAGSAKAKKHLRAFRLGVQQVVEPEAKLARQLANGHVTRVNQLPAMLRNLALRKIAPARPAPPAESRAGLVDFGVEARLLKPVGARQPGEARADHDHPRGGTARPPREDRRGGRRGHRREGKPPDEFPPRRRTHGTFVENPLDFDATNRRFRRRTGGATQHLGKRCVGHDGLLTGTLAKTENSFKPGISGALGHGKTHYLRRKSRCFFTNYLKALPQLPTKAFSSMSTRN